MGKHDCKPNQRSVRLGSSTIASIFRKKFHGEEFIGCRRRRHFPFRSLPRFFHLVCARVTCVDSISSDEQLIGSLYFTLLFYGRRDAEDVVVWIRSFFNSNI